MPAALDPQSLLLCLAAALAALALGLALLLLRALPAPGLGSLAASYAILAAGLVVLARQSTGLPTFGLVLGNLFLISGVALLLEGARIFHGLERQRWLTVALALLTPLAVYLLERSRADVAVRISVTNGIVALLFLRVALAVLASRKERRSFVTILLTAAGPAGLAIAFGMRSLFAATGKRLPDFARGDPATSATMLAALVAVVLWPLALVSTDNRRLLVVTEAAERRLAAGKKRYRDLIESAPDAMIIVDRSGEIELLNAQAERLLGYRRSELVGQPIELLVPESLRLSHGRHRSGFAETRSPRGDPASRPMGAPGQELHARRKDGVEIPVEISLSPLETDEGLLVTAAIRDISNRIRGEEELRQSEERFRSLFEQSFGYILLLDLDGAILAANPAAAAALGSAPGRPPTQALADFVVPDDREALAALLEGWGRGERPDHPLAVRIGTPAIEPRTWLVHGQRFDQLGRPPRLLANAIDVSDRIRLEEALRSKALHDPLTGLANRSLFEDRLEVALARAARECDQGRPVAVAVVFVDLDAFKAVNDRHGHAAGDSVLLQVADRLRNGVRRVDTVARWGGDEFALVLPEIAGRQAAEKVVQKLEDALHAPCQLENTQLQVAASFGLAVFPDDGDTVRALLDAADSAMYARKRA
jgi:diguanylate cyclase (GGDEF)-like protein/PAS domain S-box-containing protein